MNVNKSCLRLIAIYFAQSQLGDAMGDERYGREQPSCSKLFFMRKNVIFRWILSQSNILVCSKANCFLR